MASYRHMEWALALVEQTGIYPDAAEAIATALANAERDGLKRAAEIAQLEALKSGSRERRTKTLGLRRETYPHEYGNDISAAILAEAGEAS